MDPAVIAAIIGAAATIIAAGIGIWIKRRGDSAPNERVTAQSGPNDTPHASTGGDVTDSVVGSQVKDSVVGSQNTTINRQQYNVHIESKATKRGAELALVDLLTVYTDKESRIEFKVRNISDEVVFLKRATFTLIKQWYLPRPGARPSAQLVSWTYDVDLSRKQTSINLSQVVEPNGADRFDFRVGASDTDYNWDKYPFIGLFLYLLEISLVYNEDNKVLKSPKILLHIRPPYDIPGMTYLPPAREEVEPVKRKAQEVLSSINETVVCDQEILEAIESYAEIDLSQFDRSPEPE